MQLQRQPNAYSCLVTSFAMCLDIPVQTLMAEVGHDGTEVIFPSLASPFANRGFHVQEMIDACMARGYAVTPIEPMPSLQSKGLIWPLPSEDADERFASHLFGHTGVLVGQGITSRMHAVAWDGKSIFDPAGYLAKIEDFRIKTFYRLSWISRLDV